MTTPCRPQKYHGQSEKEQIQAKADEEETELEWKQKRFFDQRRRIIPFGQILVQLVNGIAGIFQVHNDWLLDSYAGTVDLHIPFLTLNVFKQVELPCLTNAVMVSPLT